VENLGYDFGYCYFDWLCMISWFVNIPSQYSFALPVLVGCRLFQPLLDELVKQILLISAESASYLAVQ